MTRRIAVIGAGFIGRAWAIVFARAGFSVALHDPDTAILERAPRALDVALVDIHAAGLVTESPPVIAARIEIVEDVAAALAGAEYAQECGPEDVALKREIFATLDAAATADTILASSTSGIVASRFVGQLRNPGRCLVAHPVNPPYLIPLVEVAPAPETDPEVTERTMALMAAVGQSPILVRREVDGFILNRLQGALLNEGLRLYRDGYASVEDIDRAVRDGLGRRWAFMGPMETIDLNAPGGAADYARRYGPIYSAADARRDIHPWQPDVINRLDAELRAARPLSALDERREWRDRRLMALAAHLAQAEGA
jgi:L-gulonate 3-dehydrogenase